jgi:ribokinase
MIGRGLVTCVDILVVNESEMLALATELGFPRTAVEFVSAFAERCESTAVVTLGASGVVAADSERSYQIPAPAVDVVDTTGAGDAFVGALAATLDTGRDLSEALCAGIAAGSLACTMHGAQAALPGAVAIKALAAKL